MSTPPTRPHWPTDMNPDRHYGVLRPGDPPSTGMRPEIRCGSGADVAVFPTTGYIIWSAENTALPQSGPFFVHCAQHGPHLAFLQLLEKGPGGASTMPIMLIPLPDIEYIHPIGME